MLHLIFQSSIDSALLQRIDSGDDVVFFENACYRLLKNAVLKSELQQLLENRVYLHVLAIELETRGIDVEEIVSGIKVVDSSDLVELTEKNKVIRTWS